MNKRAVSNIKKELDNNGRAVFFLGKWSFVKLTDGRREMLEARLKADKKLNGPISFLWESVNPVHEWDNEKKMYKFIGFKKAQGTYCRKVHGNLPSPAF